MRHSSIDVAIVGGGPAGAVAALVLARANHRVMLIEAAEEGAATRVGEALPPAVRPLLRDLDLLEQISNGDHLPCPGNVSIWGGYEPRFHDFLRDPNGLGLHLDRHRFDASLRAAAAEQGAQLIMATRARVLKWEQNRRWLQLRPRRSESSDDFDMVACKWLIDATGRSSSVSKSLGAQHLRDDPMVAVLGHFLPGDDAPPDRDARTLIEACAGGWWYSARLPQGERVVSFHIDPDLIDPAELTTVGGFFNHLHQTRHLNRLLRRHRYRLRSRPRGADAGSARLMPIAGECRLAVGDAAISMDPLSSQGLLTAIYTGLRGAEAVVAALAGDHLAMQRYRRRLESIYLAFLKHRTRYYALETRWPESEFWRRRLERSDLAASSLLSCQPQAV